MGTQLWNTREVAAYLNVKEATIRHWVHIGYIPHIKFRGSVRYRQETIDTWLEKMCRGHAPCPQTDRPGHPGSHESPRYFGPTRSQTMTTPSPRAYAHNGTPKKTLPPMQRQGHPPRAPTRHYCHPNRVQPATRSTSLVARSKDHRLLPSDPRAVCLDRNPGGNDPGRRWSGGKDTTCLRTSRSGMTPSGSCQPSSTRTCYNGLPQHFLCLRRYTGRVYDR